MLSKATSSTIFWVFGMTRPGIEPWSPGSLANTLLIRLMARLNQVHQWIIIYQNATSLDFFSFLKANREFRIWFSIILLPTFCKDLYYCLEFVLVDISKTVQIKMNNWIPTFTMFYWCMQLNFISVKNI